MYLSEQAHQNTFNQNFNENKNFKVRHFYIKKHKKNVFLKTNQSLFSKYHHKMTDIFF